jgi:nucleotide-binding universal stress UspA family protein
MPYKQILIALAGKDDEDDLIREAVKLSDAVGARLTVLHVNEPAAGKMTMMIDPTPLVREHDVRSRFERLGFSASADGVDVRIVQAASVAKEIARATKDADLLVIGHRQKNRFLAAVVEEIDRHIADMVACPILVVPRRRRRKKKSAPPRPDSSSSQAPN